MDAVEEHKVSVDTRGRGDSSLKADVTSVLGDALDFSRSLEMTTVGA